MIFPKAMENVNGMPAMAIDDHLVTGEIASYYRALFADYVEEKMLGSSFMSDWYAELYNLVKPEVPDDVFHKVRRRFRPIWHYIEGASS